MKPHLNAASQVGYFKLMAHLSEVEDVHRNVIDLPPITYAIQTAIGWTPSDADTFVEFARDRSA